LRPAISFASALAIVIGAAVAVFALGPGRRPFAEEIDRFVAADKARPPAKCQVLFVGDSSIRLWTSLAEDMAPVAVINRGFGGSQIPHINRYFNTIVRPYAPRAIVFYAGENDLGVGKTPDAVYAHFKHFMALKTKRLGETPVFFISVNPSKALFDQLAVQRAFNAKVAGLAAERDDLAYIDVVTPMLEGGRPRNDIYIDDGLHLNAKGYAIWKQVVGDALRAGGVDRLPCAPDS
jgi:lysophospholipase L1-like esterase